MKKQIVEASLKAFGVPIDNIIETGVAEIQALEAYIRKSAGDTQQVLEEATQRIAQFEEEVRKLRAKMEQQVQQQQGVAAACNGRKLDDPEGARVLRPGGGGPRRAGLAAAARPLGGGQGG